MTSHHVICHMTVVIYLFIIKIEKEKEKKSQKKRSIKSRKIDKRKRKILVSKHTITSVSIQNGADVLGKAKIDSYFYQNLQK